MSDGISRLGIVLLPDVASDARIRRMWSLLEDPELILPNIGRPHITAALVAEDDRETAGEALAGIAGNMQGMRIAFDSLGLFPGEQPVLFLNPVASGGLLALHRRIHDALRLSGIRSLGPNYDPGQWVPHLTLGRVSDAERLGPALAIANRFRLRFEVTFVALAAMRLES